MARIQGDLLERTFNFGIMVLGLVDDLPYGPKGWEISRQMNRSGTAVGANIREADHSLTDPEFAHKCSIARKEASETEYWLALCQRAGILAGGKVETATREANELVRILSTIVKRTQAYVQAK